MQGKLDGKTALKIGLGLGTAAVLGAAAITAVRVHSWRKDEYATELWLPLGRKGVRFTKDPDGEGISVQLGYRWMPDAVSEADLVEEEPEIELVLQDEDAADAEA